MPSSSDLGATKTASTKTKSNSTIASSYYPSKCHSSEMEYMLLFIPSIQRSYLIACKIYCDSWPRLHFTLNIYITGRFMKRTKSYISAILITRVCSHVCICMEDKCHVIAWLQTGVYKTKPDHHIYHVVIQYQKALLPASINSTLQRL